MIPEESQRVQQMRHCEYNYQDENTKEIAYVVNAKLNKRQLSPLLNQSSLKQSLPLTINLAH